MKPTKKRPSKRYSNMSDGNPIIEKLLKLKYRINNTHNVLHICYIYNITD